MLKVKEEIPLEKLSEYKFSPRYSEYTGEIVGYVYGWPRYGIRVGSEVRQVEVGSGDSKVLDILYDLITAGIVVKE